jgi:hypothetical protein
LQNRSTLGFGFAEAGFILKSIKPPELVLLVAYGTG